MAPGNALLQWWLAQSVGEAVSQNLKLIPSGAYPPREESAGRPGIPIPRWMEENAAARVERMWTLCEGPPQ